MRKSHWSESLVSWICNNPRCSHYLDTTPTSDPHSNKCLMCNHEHAPDRYVLQTSDNAYAHQFAQQVKALQKQKS